METTHENVKIEVSIKVVKEIDWNNRKTIAESVQEQKGTFTLEAAARCVDTTVREVANRVQAQLDAEVEAEIDEFEREKNKIIEEEVRIRNQSKEVNI